MISVIVAAYNAEKCLSKCLESILSQSFNDFEVVLIDDGSTDSTPSICDKYSQKDPRVRVLHKVNGGVASARQAGIDMSRGDYIIHVDADDYVKPNMLEDMSGAIFEADILISDFFLCDRKGSIHEIRQSDCSDSSDLLEAIIKGKVFGSLWNKLVRKSLYKDVRFKTDLFFCEDQLLLFEVLTKQQCKVRNLHNAYYYYVDYEGSLTRQVGVRLFENKIKYEDYVLKVLNNNNYLVQRDFFIIDRLKSYEGIVRYNAFSKKELNQIIDRLPSSNQIKTVMQRTFLKCVLLSLYTIQRNKWLYMAVTKSLKIIKVL